MVKSPPKELLHPYSFDNQVNKLHSCFACNLLRIARILDNWDSFAYNFCTLRSKDMGKGQKKKKRKIIINVIEGNAKLKRVFDTVKI